VQHITTVGDAELCAAAWDPSQSSLAPLRALLSDAARLFPAAPGPYCQLLTAMSNGPMAAAAAYHHLQVRGEL
jgi:hypothetical protein